MGRTDGWAGPERSLVQASPPPGPVVGEQVTVRLRARGRVTGPYKTKEPQVGTPCPLREKGEDPWYVDTHLRRRTPTHVILHRIDLDSVYEGPKPQETKHGARKRTWTETNSQKDCLCHQFPNKSRREEGKGWVEPTTLVRQETVTRVPCSPRPPLPPGTGTLVRRDPFRKVFWEHVPEQTQRRDKGPWGPR